MYSLLIKSLSSVAVAALLCAPVAQAKTVAGYLYTSLNGETTNHVVAFERFDDGTLGNQRVFSTGSAGGADRAAGGDAAGDFDSQGAIQIIDDYLLVVNAGGNTLSVFELDRVTGSLGKRTNVDSHGTRPVSISYMRKPGASDDYWVVVGNQWNNPNVQKGGPGEDPVEMYPNAAFHAENGDHTRKLADRNIYLFSFNSATGTLAPERSLDSYVGTNGGPTTVAFSPDGSRLAVATWGIAHFSTEQPMYQKPSRVYVYDFDGKQGTVGNVRFYEEEGVAGSIGFSWDSRTATLFVSNFNLTTEKRDHSLTVLRDTGKSVKKVAFFGTGMGTDIDEACWTTLDPTGDRLYVSSFGGNLISVFRVESDGSVGPIGSMSETVFERRKAGTPAGDTKDMLVSTDGRYLYNLGAYQTFTISKFDVADDGTLDFAAEYKVESATEMGPGAYNFLGLAGFDR